MSLTFKLLSLAIRTAAKPIGNYIKRQAKEHEGFRKFAVNQAQRVHRIDMRMRLGILHDPDAQQRMHEREQRLAEEKQRKAEQPTVRTELEQKKHDEQKAQEAADAMAGKPKEEQHKSSKPKIRPLSEARAIELGANFFSEAFIFMVAVGLLLAENYRRSAKESDRRDEVAERLEELEATVLELRSKIDPNLETLNQLHEREQAAKEKKQTTSWWNPRGWSNAKAAEEEDAAGEQDAKVDYRKLQKEAEERVQRIARQREEAKAAKEAAKEHEKKGILDRAFDSKSPEQKETGHQQPPTRVDTVEASGKGR
ncbi:OPA3-like protein [Cercospora zeina]